MHMAQGGGAVVMSLPQGEPAMSKQYQRYHPTVHNFSRPNPRPTSASAPLSKGFGINGASATETQANIQTSGGDGSALQKDWLRSTNKTLSLSREVQPTVGAKAAPGTPTVDPIPTASMDSHQQATAQTTTIQSVPEAPRQFPASPSHAKSTESVMPNGQSFAGQAPHSVLHGSNASNTPQQDLLQPLQSPSTISLRQRHTLQVPKAQTGRSAAQSSAHDAASGGRFSPTSSAPRRASVSLARRHTRSTHSDNHLEEVPPDEDAAKWAEAIKAKRASKRRKEEEAEDDKVVVGTKVDHNHVNWVTAYNMLTGIRFVVSRINAKMDRALTEADFDAKHKFSFDITGNELTPSAKYDFKFKDYSPWVFRHLRMKFGLDPADYLMSLTSKYILSELGSPGKSGSFFYFSRDYKYIIKTIHHSEHRFLRRILRDYHQHVEENPNTLISQFYGLHRVKTPFGRKIHFVVMNNLFPPHRDIHQTFDLKGSTIGRDYKEENLADNPRATLKDLNWLRRDMHLNFGPQKKELFVQQVERDVKLLQKLGIMDYSLLLGIHDLTRGNRDDIRNSALKVFQPGGAEGDELHGHMLQRTPSKMEKARQARELRKIINTEVPIKLGQNAENRLPEEFSEHKNTVFYADDGGFRATHENDEPANVIYYLGIIDCLTHYGFVKKMEHFWRGLSHPKDQVSAIPPFDYGERFFKFITSIIMSPEEAERRGDTKTAQLSEEEPVMENLHQGAGSAGTACGTGVIGEGGQTSRGHPTVRSPSADKGAPGEGSILPAVEEAGESSSRHPGSNGGKSGSESVQPPSSTRFLSAQDDAGASKNSLSGKPDSAISIEATILQNREPEELAIRVARVSG